MYGREIVEMSKIWLRICAFDTAALDHRVPHVAASFRKQKLRIGISPIVSRLPRPRKICPTAVFSQRPERLIEAWKSDARRKSRFVSARDRPPGKGIPASVIFF